MSERLIQAVKESINIIHSYGCEGKDWQSAALNAVARLEESLTGECLHEWHRRRDGRSCHKCGKVEFGKGW